jgi:hypothetical protein
MTLKEILPFEDYTLTTRLSVNEIIKRLNDNTEEKRNLSFSSFGQNYQKPYTGHITSSTFTMSRNINYRNSFLPVITGRITALGGQTQVNIKMRPVLIVSIFISFWLGIVGLICAAILLTGLIQFKDILQNGFPFGIIIPFGMFAFGCLLTHFAFKTESKKSKEFLAKLLQGIDG